MKPLDGSLVYQSGRRTLIWVAHAGACSLVGRLVLVLFAVLRTVFGSSRVFGVAHVGSRTFGVGDEPVAVKAFSLPYARARTAAGAASERLGWSAWNEATHARFAGGRWLRVAGCGLLGLGGGRLAALVGDAAGSGGFAAAAILTAVGLVLLLVGPRLALGARGSLLWRAAGGPPWRPGRTLSPVSASTRMIVAAGAVLAAAGGALLGVGSGSQGLTVAAGVIGLALVLGAFLKPQLILLAVAAFPWIDWLARRTLVGVGAGWDDALLLFSVVVLLWCVLAVKKWELSTVPIALPAFLAFGAAVGSVVVREVPTDVAIFSLRVLFQPLLFYFFGFLFPKNAKWVKGTVAVFLVASTALALHGLYQYVTHAPMPASWVDVRETDIVTRAYSVIENPNGLGAFLLMGVMLSLSLLLGRAVRGVRLAVVASVAVIQLAGVAVTFSRGAWLGLGAGIVVLLVFAYRRWLAPLVAAGVLAWFVVPSSFTNRLVFAFSSTYIAKSLVAGRLYVWGLALQHISAHPLFGLGLGTFGGTAAVTFGYGRLWVDNFYLQLGAEGGLLLLGLFIWVLLRAAKGLVKAHGLVSEPFTKAFVAGVFGGFIAVAAANATASVWETLVVGVAFWFFAGFATSAGLHQTQMDAAAPDRMASGDNRPQGKKTRSTWA